MLPKFYIAISWPDEEKELQQQNFNFCGVLTRSFLCRLSNIVLHGSPFLLWSCYFSSPDRPSEET